jgi:hypothetical protein
VLTTGDYKPATQATQRELENIAKENELLGKGESVVAISADRHWMHIPEHAGVAASPDTRKDQRVADAIAAHLEEHLALLRGTDPVMLTIQGCPQPVIQTLVASMAPPPMPGATSGTPPPIPGETSGTALPPAGVGDAAGMPGMPQMPQMPTDPLSGEQMPMPAGVA